MSISPVLPIPVDGNSIPRDLSVSFIYFYRDALRLQPLEASDGSLGLPEYAVSASSFMAFHSILRNSQDYTEALRWSRRLVDSLSASLGRNLTLDRRPDAVFSYSVFYVFYEQYLTMWRDTLESLLVSLLAIFCVTFVLMGFDLASSAVILLVITMILVNMFGLMFWWEIQLNAISLVNLVMAVGISVEFCSHLTRAFSVCVAESKVARARTTLVTMGSSVRKIDWKRCIGGAATLLTRCCFWGQLAGCPTNLWGRRGGWMDIASAEIVKPILPAPETGTLFDLMQGR